MPTQYLWVTEEQVLKEYRNKLEETEGEVTFERITPPGPDALFNVGSSHHVWVEVSSIYRSQKEAEFLNKNGLSNSNADLIVTSTTALGTISDQLSQMLKGIEDRIYAKESKESYRSYLEKYGKGVLVLYVDQPLFCDVNLKKILDENPFSKRLLKQFYAIYLYVPRTHILREGEDTQMGGFYSLIERPHISPIKGEILLFQTEDGNAQIEVLMHGETVWLSLNEMAQLFQIHKSGLSRHLKNIFETSELQRDATVANFATVQEEGGRKVIRDLEYYNLDVIIATGYRVNSHRGTQFRIWATNHLKEFIIKGFVLNDQRLKNESKNSYFEELLGRIRDIRSSEKIFWRKVLDIYATSVDYDAKSDVTQEFFKVVQNKMHWAAHGHTAAEIIYNRANSDQQHMGMKTWAGSVPRKADVGVAKNYLSQEELNILNRLVNAYLEFAELQALNRQPMYMKDWIAKLDDFVKLSGRDILAHAGKVSHTVAMEKAYAEYEKFSKDAINATSSVEEHFLEAVKKIEKQSRS